MNIQKLREQGNLFLYGNKDMVLRIGKILSLTISLLAILVLIFYYGFPLDEKTKDLCLSVIQGSFLFYVLHYLVRFIYDFHPKQFLRDNWFEGILMGILVVEGYLYTFHNFLLIPYFFKELGVKRFKDVSTIFIQVYFFSVIWLELARSGPLIPRFKLNPALIFILSFVIIILTGTGLLMLPEMSNTVNGMGFLDALFTSSSATCVTGLMVVDTPVFFTFKGEVVLLILMKLGGLNIIAFGSFLALASKFGVGVKQHDVLEDFVNKGTVLSAKGMLRKVVLWSTGIELLGALMMQIFWDEKIAFVNEGQKWFYSIFHSVSAFNNAGISLFSGGLGDPLVADNYYIHWVVTILVFFGALGMLAIFDLFDPGNLRGRMRNPWKRIGFPTKIALYFSLGLVIAGSVLYYVLEIDNTLADMSLFGQVTTSVFQSVTRTSGFNTVDIGMVGIPMLFIIIILMFIGSSSSSTGGGIKTSTFAIISADIIATIRGYNYTELFQRTIPKLLVKRAYSVLLFFVVGNLLFIFLLTITESHILAMEGRTILDLIFEQVSAMGTVGLSMGITSSLSDAGKVIIVLSMIIGRVGTLTVAFALGGKLIRHTYKYPTGHTMVG
jgi:trk system potassium uptake protein